MLHALYQYDKEVFIITKCNGNVVSPTSPIVFQLELIFSFSETYYIFRDNCNILVNIAIFVTSFLFYSQIQRLYDDYLYHHVSKLVTHFLANTLSPVYCHLIKDRLYCDEAASPTRLAAVEIMRETLTVFARSIAPIVPHLAEEAWLHHPVNLGKRSRRRSLSYQRVKLLMFYLQRRCRYIILNTKSQKRGINRKLLHR